VVNETDDKEKLEQFINFCEDTIFEVKLWSSFPSIHFSCLDATCSRS
jgi:hypothetical protein